MSGLSIVVTYYKGRDFIFNCINSLLDAYERSSKHLNYEIIIVIDSIEDAAAIESDIFDTYKDANIVIEKNLKNIGVSASRNLGLEIIRYQYFTIIDQDDYVKPEYFSVLEKELRSDIPIHIMNGVISYINDGIDIPIYFFKPRFRFKNLILKDTFIYTPGLIIFNSIYVNKNNLFIDTSSKYKGCDDWAAYLNLILSYNKEISYKFINRPLFAYCLHATNYSHNKGEMIRSSEAVLKYLENDSGLTHQQHKLVEKAQNMQKFYYARDVHKLSKSGLFFNYTDQFLYHYLFSIFNMDNLNKLVIKFKYFVRKSNI